MPATQRSIAPSRARRPRSCNKLIALTGLSLLVGCSSYESKWRDIGPHRTTADPIEGRWIGTWQSDANQHAGGLRCILTRTGPASYDADYHATYWKIFSFGYSMPVTVRSREGETTHFKGEADLGWLAGGKYTYSGQVDPKAFQCDYKSASDHGTFTLKRPEESPK